MAGGAGAQGEGSRPRADAVLGVEHGRDTPCKRGPVEPAIPVRPVTVAASRRDLSVPLRSSPLPSVPFRSLRSASAPLRSLRHSTHNNA